MHGKKHQKKNGFLNSFKETCKLLNQPFQHVAVDERMVKSKHRSGIRQYIKNKPTAKWGIMLWILADSANGYTYDFDVYTGWRSGEECSENGLGYDVVRKRSHPLENQGYHLYLDNFYTSPTLVKDLYSVQIPSCGTAAENRRGFPETFEERQRMGKKKRKRYYAMGQGWKNVGNMVTGLLLTQTREMENWPTDGERLMSYSQRPSKITTCI